jgi:putative peptidoglycan lipid II flippase
MGTLQLRISQFWQRWTSGSTARQLFGAAVTIAGVTLFVKALAVVKEFAIAWKLGTGDSVDAFLMAFLMPSFVISVVASSFTSTVMPIYIQVREQQGQQAAKRLLAGAGLMGIVVLTLLMGVIAGLAPFYLPSLAHGFSEAKLDLTLRLLWLMVPLIGINGLAFLGGAILNAEERFVLVALAPGLTSLAMLGLLLQWPQLQAYALAGGLLIGASLELAIVLWSLRRKQLLILPRWSGWSPELIQAVRQFGPMVAGACLFSTSDLIDQAMASRLSPGSVAALSYGNKMISLPLTLLTTAIGTAVMPYFAKLVAQADWTGLHRLLHQVLTRTFWGCALLAGILAIFSGPIVQLLFQRGAFQAEDTALVARIQTGFALQLPFHLCGIIIVKLISAMQANHILVYSAIVSVSLNLLLNVVFMHWFGIAGIALSTSCVYIFAFSFLLWSWQRLSRKLPCV